MKLAFKPHVSHVLIVSISILFVSPVFTTQSCVANGVSEKLEALKTKLTGLRSSLVVLKNKLVLLSQRLIGVKERLSWLTYSMGAKFPTKIDWPRSIIFDRAGFGGDYQWTFDDSKNLNVKVYNVTVNLFGEVPAIGYYNEGNEYNFRMRKFLVAMLSEMVVALAPRGLVREITSQLSIRSNKADFSSDLQSKSINFYFHATATGVVENQKADPIDKTYNMLFHGFLAPVFDVIKTFQSDVLMGVFQRDGVTNSGSIAFDNLTKQDVHFHEADSPDNAKFKVDDGRKVSTFWSAAISPDAGDVKQGTAKHLEKRVIVTYHLLINDKDLEAKLIKIFAEKSFGALLRRTSEVAKDTTALPNEKDRAALAGFVATLRKATLVK